LSRDQSSVCHPRHRSGSASTPGRRVATLDVGSKDLIETPLPTHKSTRPPQGHEQEAAGGQTHDDSRPEGRDNYTTVRSQRMCRAAMVVVLGSNCQAQIRTAGPAPIEALKPVTATPAAPSAPAGAPDALELPGRQPDPPLRTTLGPSCPRHTLPLQRDALATVAGRAGASPYAGTAQPLGPVLCADAYEGGAVRSFGELSRPGLPGGRWQCLSQCKVQGSG